VPNEKHKAPPPIRIIFRSLMRLAVCFTNMAGDPTS
jgi:hypothetical protein